MPRPGSFQRYGNLYDLASISKNGSSWYECAILIPDLTRHTETAEIIASSFLRELLPVNDGEFVFLMIK